MALGDMINKAKGYARQNPDKAKKVIDKIGTTVDQKTQGKYRDQVNKASNAVGGALGVERDGQQGQVSGDGQQGSDASPQGQAPEQKSQTDGTDRRDEQGGGQQGQMPLQ